MLDAITTEIFPSEGHGAPNDRIAQAEGETGLPTGTLVFSADDHVSVGEDIFYNNFPAHLKGYAPRLWRDEEGVFQIGMNGKSFLPPAFVEVVSHFERRPGCDAANVEARLADMDAEGVDKSLVFPNEVLGTLAFPDHALREMCFQIYNEYIAEWQARAPGRLHAVGLINWWDPAGTRRSLEQLKSLGLNTFLMPLNPFTFADGTNIDYGGKAMIPVWEEIEPGRFVRCHRAKELDLPGIELGEAVAAG